jgi:hypothetical protein
LARLFQAAGHYVVTAESVPWHGCCFSGAVVKNYRVPAPRFAPAAYLAAIKQIVQREEIDYLVPTCEEIFTLAAARADFGPACTLFCESLERLHRLHHKWHFYRLARQYDLPVPATRLITDRAQAEAALAGGSRLVFKPAYSRSGSKTIILPADPAGLAGLDAAPARPWLAQAYVAGPEICTYSLAWQGRLAAYGAYRPTYRLGPGSAIAWQAVAHPAARAWVERFVANYDFTGQIAFDFIAPAASPDQVVALECNPRLTSGLHLFRHTPALAQLFFQEPQHCLQPDSEATQMFGLIMLWAGLTSLAAPARYQRWWTIFRASRDVIFCPSDPWPFFSQWLNLLPFFYWQIRYRLGALPALTFDIEWNGEGLDAGHDPMD